MKITSGKINKAQKVVVYGPEGIGKSTFASKFPDPLFIDTEGSTIHLDVKRLDRPTSWAMLTAQIQFVKDNKPCSTLVIDTIDWAERLATDYITAKANKNSITEFGYGEGFIKLEEEFGRFLNKLSDLTEVGINVVLTAHTKIVKFELPDETGAFDRWELKLGNKTTAKTAALTKEWADAVLFANYKTLVVQGNERKGERNKAQGGTRVMYTSHHPAWDAKNRWNLNEEIPFDYTAIENHVPNMVDIANLKAKVEEPVVETEHKIEVKSEQKDIEIYPEGQLGDLMKASKISVQELMNYVVNVAKHFPAGTPFENLPSDYTNGALVANWDKVSSAIKLVYEQNPKTF